MSNRWGTTKEPLARWIAELPPALWHQGRPLSKLVEQVLDAGEQTGIFRVGQGQAPPDGTGRARWSSAVEEAWRAGARTPLFPARGPLALPAEAPRPWARVAVFGSGGAVVERETSDLGALLRELRPDLAGVSPSLLPHVQPVSVDGPVALDTAQPLTIAVSLGSDLWFPRVLGLHEPDDEEEGVALRFSNAQLAASHTPRLNRFLEILRSLVLDAGGSWALDEVAGIGEHYAGFVEDSGIRLSA